MWSRRAVFLSLPSLAAAPALASAFARRAEIDALRRFAEETHPRGREARDDAPWRATWAALAASADSLSDGEYFVRTRRALGWFRDGHTTLLPFEFVGGVPKPLGNGDFGFTLPIALRAFDDGLFVVAASRSATKPLGRRVTQLNASSDVDLMRRLAIDWPGNVAWSQNWAGGILSSPAQLQGLDVVARAEAAITIHTGDVLTRLEPRRGTKEALTRVSRPPLDHETWATTASAGNYVRDLGDGITYVSIDDMSDVEGQTFADLSKNALEAAARARRVIIDLRRNGGGNNYLAEPLRRGLARMPINRPGGLYVLIGPQTFSAAQNFANRLERETFARFIGTPTGGSPNHYGDAKPFVGDVTGITSIVSTLPWFDSYPQDHRPWIMPDVLVPERAADWLAGRDRGLEAAIADVAPEIDEISRDRVFYFDRPSQKQRWETFW